MYVCSLPASYSFPSPASLSEGNYSCDSGIGVHSTSHASTKPRCLRRGAQNMATAFACSSAFPAQTHFSVLLRDSGPFGAMFNSPPMTL